MDLPHPCCFGINTCERGTWETVQKTPPAGPLLRAVKHSSNATCRTGHLSCGGKPDCTPHGVNKRLCTSGPADEARRGCLELSAQAGGALVATPATAAGEHLATEMHAHAPREIDDHVMMARSTSSKNQTVAVTVEILRCYRVIGSRSRRSAIVWVLVIDTLPADFRVRLFIADTVVMHRLCRFSEVVANRLNLVFAEIGFFTPAALAGHRTGHSGSSASEVGPKVPRFIPECSILAPESSQRNSGKLT